MPWIDYDKLQKLKKAARKYQARIDYQREYAQERRARLKKGLRKLKKGGRG